MLSFTTSSSISTKSILLTKLCFRTSSATAPSPPPIIKIFEILKPE